MMVEKKAGLSFEELYRGFSVPVTGIDCGEKCGPFNDYGVPVCCDIQLVVPSAYDLEWDYLQEKTDLWNLWQGSSEIGKEELTREIQPGQVLLQCLGQTHCQREFRSLTCRAFPFFPYLDSAGNFKGLSYYREYRDQCWVISNLSLVNDDYKKQFRWVFEKIFSLYPSDKENYQGFSNHMRDQAADAGREIPLLDFAGRVHIINPGNEQIREITYHELDCFGPFGIIKELVFPDEIQGQQQIENN
ncbi:MAG: hypothetical protein MUO54_03145 [Anaerolineales bacterium]|nr:hypothetical protein [Anaerolineales bacterium]